MKIVEVSGDARTIGQGTGEELREEIRAHIEQFPPIPNREAWERRLPVFLDALRAHLPAVLAEMEGTAEGAGLPLDDILGLNLPMYPRDLDGPDGCTNIAFAGGPEGPVWGKNNDGGPPEGRRPACGRLVRRDDAIPVLVFTFCGMVATTDGMNGEGLAMGHSSVGSIFQQSDHHLPIRLWAYECMMQSRTTREFVRRLASRPTRGKGYSVLCVDREGVMCSIEAPCPVVQVRWPDEGQLHMNCVNYYQLPSLAQADRRPELGKLNAQYRRRFIEDRLSGEADLGLATMQALLRRHGNPSLCRHGDGDGSHTEYAMIGLPQQGRVLYLDGYPCEEEFGHIAL